MTMMTKLPTDARPLIQDPDLAAAVEALLEPYSGKQLERAHTAIRKVRASAVQGTFSTIVAAYQAAIEKAVGD